VLAELRERDDIEAVLRRDAALHFYALGDLDDFFFPHSRWFGLEEDGNIREIALLYESSDGVVLHALGRDVLCAQALLSALMPALPERLYAHLSPGLAPVVANHYAVAPHGTHLKMVLEDRAACRGEADEREVVVLRPVDLPEVEAFYAAAYPGNWFDARMLHTERYLGIRVDGELAAIAGLHVHSLKYKIAALGNIATHPRHRRHGLAYLATRALCRRLLDEVDVIGLNVDRENVGAIDLYRRLGFRSTALYEELSLTKRSTP
jgi:ribosomal protein S18 acetylase RimI-like enzyme